MGKTVKEINDKINKGEAVVLTATEFCQRIRDGEKITINDVDVVTTATRAVMSGIAVIFSIKISERGEFRKAKEIYLNGVPGYVGPCPNERLGIVDCFVYGSSVSKNNPREYGGGHLFRDILENRTINCEVITVEGRKIEKEISKDDFIFGRMISTRNVYRNYMAFTNLKDDSVPTIFHVKNFEGPLKEITFSGCGEINPLEKDPEFLTIGIGTRILVNGAVGYIMGLGTRSTKNRPNLSLYSEFFDMNPKYMGGFITAAGPETINAIAIVAIRTMGGLGFLIISFCGFLATLTSLNAAIIASARICYALSRDGYFPDKLSYLDKETSSPRNAVILSGILSLMFTATGIAYFVVSVTDFLLLLALALINYSVIGLRKKRPFLKRPFRTPFYPILPILATFTNIVLLPVTALLHFDAFIIGSVVIALGVLFYAYKMVGFERIKMQIGGMDIGMGFILLVMGLYLISNAILSPLINLVMAASLILMGLLTLIIGLIHVVY